MTALIRRDLSGARAEGLFVREAGPGLKRLTGRLTRRLGDALELGRARRVEREMARILAQSGGRLTDSVEREMTRRLLRSDWSSPR